MVMDYYKGDLRLDWQAVFECCVIQQQKAQAANWLRLGAIFFLHFLMFSGESFHLLLPAMGSVSGPNRKVVL